LGSEGQGFQRGGHRDSRLLVQERQIANGLDIRGILGQKQGIERSPQEEGRGTRGVSASHPIGGSHDR
jgi:hypothetical protein